MASKRKLLTQEQFDTLNTTANWNLDEVPIEHWRHIPGLQRLEDTFGIMASGCLDDPRILNGIHAVAGLDVLVCETRPTTQEPEGNAYHYVVQRTGDDTFPFVLHGPFRSETIVDHWFEAQQIDKYWAAGEG